MSGKVAYLAITETGAFFDWQLIDAEAIETDFAGADTIACASHEKRRQRALAGAMGSDEGMNFTSFQDEIPIFQDRIASGGEVHTPDLQ